MRQVTSHEDDRTNVSKTFLKSFGWVAEWTLVKSSNETHSTVKYASLRSKTTAH